MVLFTISFILLCLKFLNLVETCQNPNYDHIREKVYGITKPNYHCHCSKYLEYPNLINSQEY